MPGTGSVSGEATAERNTMYPVGLPVAAVQDVVMVVAVTAENTSAVGCAPGAAAKVVAVAVGAEAVR